MKLYLLCQVSETLYFKSDLGKIVKFACHRVFREGSVFSIINSIQTLCSIALHC